MSSRATIGKIDTEMLRAVYAAAWACQFTMAVNNEIKSGRRYPDNSTLLGFAEDAECAAEDAAKAMHYRAAGEDAGFCYIQPETKR